MDNLQDGAKSNADSSEENFKDFHDPAVEPCDDSKRIRQEVKSAEIIQSAKKITVPDANVLPPQIMGMVEGMQTIPSVGDIIKSMLRFKWTILIVFLIITVPAIAAIWTQIVPVYRAEAEVRVRPIIPYLVFQTEDSGKIPVYDSFVNTQVSIITNTIVLQRVLDQQQVKQTRWYNNPSESLFQRLTGAMPTALERLEDNLSAKPRRDTEIIDVTFTDSNLQDAQVIANAVLDQYIKYIGEMSDATQDKIYNQLVDQYKSLEQDILGREKVIAELRQQLGTAIPEELISGRRVRLDETQARLDELRQSITLLEWEKQQIDVNEVNKVSVDPNDNLQEQQKYYEDERWQKLDADVRRIRHNIANSRLTPNHPDAARLQEELKFAQEELQQREKQLDELWRNSLHGASVPIAGAGDMSYEEALKYLEHQLSRLRHEEQLLNDKFKQQQAQFNDLFERTQLLEKESNTLQHKRELFDAVRQRVDQKNMERNVPGSIEVLTRAIVPIKPYSDRRAAFTFMVLVMALGASGGLAYLRASKTQAIYTPKDMPHPMQVPFLGYISMTPDAGSSNNKISPTTLESIRVVRTALLSRLNGQPCPELSRGNCTTVLVTSASEGTGKSSFSIMLGKSLARSGKKVLLIDADFQKKTLTKRFGLYEESGFVQSLHRRLGNKQHVFPTDTSGLSIMPAGKLDEDNAEFEEIANGAFSIFIDKLRKKYNIILLDSPPVLPVADAAILSGQVDGTIIVERELVSRRTDVINALVRLNSTGGRLLGTVFIGSEANGKY